jgi:hypothetical protein
MLKLPLEQFSTEDLVRDHRSLVKLLGNDSMMVRAIWAEIRNRQKAAKKAA